MKCYDLDNLDVVIVKDWDSLITILNQLLACCQAIDQNTDEIESKLDAQIVLLTSIDTELSAQGLTLDSILADTTAILAQLVTLNATDFATETTLLAIKAKTDQLTFTSNKLRTTGEDGGGGGGTSFNDKLLQVDSVGTTTYLGYADAGSLTSAAVWAVKKIVETGSDVSITWADGNKDFDNIWDDRLTLTYS